MKNANEDTRKGGIGPDNGQNKEQNAATELHACKASEQPGRVPEKCRRLAPAARKNAGAYSPTRSRMCSKRDPLVKVSGVNVDKQEAASFTTYRHNLNQYSGSVITSCGLSNQHGEAS